MARNNETKATIQIKMTQLLAENEELKNKLNNKVTELNKEISKLSKENKELRSMKVKILEDDDLLKFMLEEKAKNKTISMIKRELSLKYNKELSNQDIIDRIGNIQDLSMDLQKFYYEKMKANNENREVIDEIERKNDLDRFNVLYDKLDSLLCSLDEDNPDHRQLIVNTTDKMVSLMDKKNKINKDVIGNADEDKKDTIINIMSEDYEKQKESVFRFQIDDNVKILQ